MDYASKTGHGSPHGARSGKTTSRGVREQQHQHDKAHSIRTAWSPALGRIRHALACWWAGETVPDAEDLPVLAAAGLPTDPGLDGMDLLPYVDGRGTAMPERDLFWRFWGQTAVRSGDWKLVLAGDYKLLFNLKDDLGETKNVIGEQAGLACGGEQLKQLRTTLLAKVAAPRATPRGGSPAPQRRILQHFLVLL